MLEQVSKDKKHNLKIYSLYRSISIDFLFYYVIEFLFLTQVKGMSEAAVTLSYAYYAVFKIILQMPVNYIIKLIGNKKSIIIGNCLNILFIILISQCNSAFILILTSLVSATGFSFKEVADLSLLKLSIPEVKIPSEIYARAEAKGYKNYYLINALTSMVAGSLFMVNPYFPLISSILFILVSIFIALAFTDIKNDEKNVTKLSKTQYLEDIKKQNKFIFNSPRLRCIYIYIGIIVGIFNLLNTYRTSLLVDSKIANQYITIIIAFIEMSCAIGSKFQKKYADKFKNKSMSIIITYISLSIVILGLCGKNINNNILKVIAICSMLTSIGIFKGINNVIVSKYLSNFVDESLLPQILAVNEICKYSFVAIINSIGAMLLIYFNISEACIYIGAGSLIIGMLLIIYMKNRLGLKPEQYSSKDIYDKKSLMLD